MAEIAWKNKALLFPDSPGVYQFFDEKGQCLYVGKAASLKERIKAYLVPLSNLGEKERAIREKAVDLRFIVTSNEVEALITEATLAKKLQPPFNIRLKDDKKFPFLRISLGDSFPRLSIVRARREGKDRYFGPFTNAKALRSTLKTLKQVFLVPSCKIRILPNKPKEPCLEHRIQRCSAPCAGKISQEDYQQAVRGIILFLEGRGDDLLAILDNRMKENVRKLNFEGAAYIRDQIFSLRRVMQTQTVLTDKRVNRDLVAFHRELDQTCMEILKIRRGRLIGEEHLFFLGEKGECLDDIAKTGLAQYYAAATDLPREIVTNLDLLGEESLPLWLWEEKHVKLWSCPKRGEKAEQMKIALANARDHLLSHLQEQSISFSNMSLLTVTKETLGLTKLPVLIEGYDISNLARGEIVGSKVVFRCGEKERKSYRHYRIHQKEQDDYSALAEVLRRRISSAETLPDLFLLDGGMGHLGIALKIMREAQVAVDALALAKQTESIFSPQFPEPFTLPAYSPVLQLLQRVRDEAHRFALAFHRKLRGKRLRHSRLEEIPGIGEAKKKILLKTFNSFSALKKVSYTEILSIPGLGEKTARKIYTYLHSPFPARGNLGGRK